MSALNKQEGGKHYRGYKIQPVEYIIANGIGFLAGNVIKYVTRYRDKLGAEDIRKAIHYLELILEFEYPGAVDLAGIQKQRVSSDYGKTDSKDAQCHSREGFCPGGPTLPDRGQEPRAERLGESIGKWYPVGEGYGTRKGPF
jgi:hypothetical protein